MALARLHHLALVLLSVLQGRHAMGGAKEFVKVRHVRDAATSGDIADRFVVGGQGACGMLHADVIDVVRGC